MIKAAVIFLVLSLSMQLSPRMEALMAAVRPVLPFPGASADGELPEDNSAASRWFVVWPTEAGDTRIVVKANPLHPETQKAGAEAMGEINAAVAAAERRAQAAYDKAMAELRRTGKAADLDVVTLDDEGIAGERIDAELEVTIELLPVDPYTLASREAPTVVEGRDGPAWVVSVAPNTYRPRRGADTREHFRPAEVRLYFGNVTKPVVARDGDEPQFRVQVEGERDAFAVVLRGNAEFVSRLMTDVNWMRLTEQR